MIVADCFAVGTLDRGAIDDTHFSIVPMLTERKQKLLRRRGHAAVCQYAHRLCLVFCWSVTMSVVGCAGWHREPLPYQPPPVDSSGQLLQHPCHLGPGCAADPLGATQPPSGLPNPLPIRVVDPRATWETLSDIVDDYFPIAEEQPVRLADGVLVEGIIETQPQSGATWLEPHRPDSVTPYARSLATFQTLRRRARMRAIPTENGYLIDLQVLTEIEDLPHPETATAGSATLRTDTSLSDGTFQGVSRSYPSDRWIVLGREVALEQQMLAEIAASFP